MRSQRGNLVAVVVLRVPASRVVWGLTILKNAPNGPEPITPPTVSREDYREMPSALRPLVRPVHSRH